MPKIIENVREKILEEAKKQVLELGYSSMTIRSVSKAVGIATGTVYNYFPSKEMMVASFMMEDWMITVERIKSGCEVADNARDILKVVYDSVIAFTTDHEEIFSDQEAVKGYTGAYGEKHGMLISQIADTFNPYIGRYILNPTEHFSVFLSEALMNWIMARRDFAEFAEITKTLFM